MPRNIIHAIDIGSENIKAVCIEKRPDDSALRILGASLIASAGMRRGSVIKSDQLVPKIKEAASDLERISGIPLRHVFLTFGSPALGFQKARGRIAISRADGEIASHDLDRALKQARPTSQVLANREVLETFGLNYMVDSEISTKDAIGIKGENLEVEALFVTALRKPLGALIECVESAGLAVDDVIPAPLASNRSLLTLKQREVGAVTADIGAETLSVAVIEENTPYSLAVFPIGSEHITMDIALGFQVSLPEAEKIKCTNALTDDSQQAKKKFASIVEARLEDMFELVEGHLKKVGRAGLLPGGIVIGGGGSRIPGIAELAKSILRLPADTGKCLDLEDNHKLKDPIWAAAIGVARLAFDEERFDRVNLKKPSVISQKVTSWLRSLIP